MRIFHARLNIGIAFSLMILLWCHDAAGQELRVYVNEGYGLQFRLEGVPSWDCDDGELVISFSADLNDNSLGSFEFGYIWNEDLEDYEWITETPIYEVTSSVYTPGLLFTRTNVLEVQVDPDDPGLDHLSADWWEAQMRSEEELETEHGGDSSWYKCWVFAQFYRNGSEMADARGWVIGSDEIRIVDDAYTAFVICNPITFTVH